MRAWERRLQRRGVTFPCEGGIAIMVIETLLFTLARLPDRRPWMFVVLASALFFASSVGAQTVHVDITPAHAVKFDPDQALGGSMDILPTNQIDRVYSEAILKESL
jgi:hypothetical protein